MKRYVEKLIKEYPEMLRQRQVTISQMNRAGFTEDDMILALSFSHSNEERVSSSERADRTGKVAISFREITREMNEDFFFYLARQFDYLDQEIQYFEGAIFRLPEEEAEVMRVLILEGKTWEELERVMNRSKSGLSYIRKKAIDSLVRDYQRRETQVAAYLLS